MDPLIGASRVAGHRSPAEHFYGRVLAALHRARLPFLVGGAYAFARLTGIGTHTKDLDLFVRRADCRRVLRCAAAVGGLAAVPHPHWLAKVHGPAGVIDVIFNTGNGVLPVDDEWFAHASPAEVLGVPVQLTPVEETLVTKAFVMERERYDGADVIHLLYAAGAQLDWARLLRRFGPHWRVLLSHLILFGYVYPDRAAIVPPAVLDALVERLRGEAPPGAGRLCRGGFLSRAQYSVALSAWGYADARRAPSGPMSAAAVAAWTAAAPLLPHADDGGERRARWTASSSRRPGRRRRRRDGGARGCRASSD